MTQIKKLKKDKKSLKDKLEHCIQEEVSKSPVVTAPLEDKGMNTKPVNTTTQKEDKSIKGKTHSHDAIQMMKIPNKYFVSNSTTAVPKENQKIATHLIRESQTKIIPYRDQAFSSASFEEKVF